MLRLRWVDCEHWDVFSVWSGRNTMTPAERRDAEERKPAPIKQRAEEATAAARRGDQQIRELIQTGQAAFRPEGPSAHVPRIARLDPSGGGSACPDPSHAREEALDRLDFADGRVFGPLHAEGARWCG